MKITAHDLYALNIVEQVIPEYGTADEKACESISRYMKGHMKEFLERQNGKTGEQLAEALCEIPCVLIKRLLDYFTEGRWK